MSGELQSYILDGVLSLLVICPVILLYFIIKRYLSSSWIKRKHVKIIFFLIAILCLSLLIEIWDDKSTVIHNILLYKNFFPGYESIILIISAAIISYLLHLWLLRKVITNSDYDISKRYKMRLIARWASWVTFFILTLIIILLQTGWNNIGTFLGLIGAGIALSLQESVLSLLGWLYIIFGHIYDIGDRIEANAIVGDVIGITPTHTRLLEISTKTSTGQSTGKILTFPNSVVLRNPVYNFTAGFPFIWIEIPTIVTFESDWKKASELILEISKENCAKLEPEVLRNLAQMQDEYAIHYQYLSPKVYTTITDYGVNLTLRLLVPVRSCRQREHEICISLLDTLDKNQKIELAYPTSRIYRRTEELNI